MLITTNPQPTLWETILPPGYRDLPRELAAVDALLGDPVFFLAVVGAAVDPGRDLPADDVPGSTATGWVTRLGRVVRAGTADRPRTDHRSDPDSGRRRPHRAQRLPRDPGRRAQGCRDRRQHGGRRGQRRLQEPPDELHLCGHPRVRPPGVHAGVSVRPRDPWPGPGLRRRSPARLGRPPPQAPSSPSAHGSRAAPPRGGPPRPRPDRDGSVVVGEILGRPVVAAGAQDRLLRDADVAAEAHRLEVEQPCSLPDPGVVTDDELPRPVDAGAVADVHTRPDGGAEGAQDPRPEAGRQPPGMEDEVRHREPRHLPGDRRPFV